MRGLTDKFCKSNLDYDVTSVVKELRCPICGGELKQARSGTRKDTLDPSIIAKQYRFTCERCGANFYSLEQRPVGEEPCCTLSLQRSRVRQHSALWFEVGDGALCRELVHTCPTCGRTYTWYEKLVLKGG